MSAKFTGAARALTERAKERSKKNQGNYLFQKLLNVQELLADKVEALETLHTNRKQGQGEEETLRYASKFEGELPKIMDDFVKAKAEFETGMRAGLYEHSGLVQSGYSAEIRSFIRSIPLRDRYSLINEAIKNKDTKILSAILHEDVPPALAGIDAKIQTRYRDDFFKLVLPEFVQTIDSYRDLCEHITATYDVAGKAASTYSDKGKLNDLNRAEAMYEIAEKKLSG